MQCLICGSAMAPDFVKVFGLPDLPEAAYHRCPDCGFCASHTHLAMPEAQWERVNDAFHSVSHHRDDNPYNRNQRYAHQAQMLHLLSRRGLIRGTRWLDWGCGVGAVSGLLDALYGMRLWTYDRYFTPEVNAIAPADMQPGGFDLVLNTAVFEHVRDRRTLDEIASYVAPGGCLAIHTLVPEVVPRDPDWMYLLPVHTAFHTNRSMQRLMDDWGYTCSVYNEHAKLWVWFRDPPAEVEAEVRACNELLGWTHLKFKVGFMDYWK